MVKVKQQVGEINVKQHKNGPKNFSLDCIWGKYRRDCGDN